MKKGGWKECFFLFSPRSSPIGSSNNRSIIVKPAHITTAIFKGLEDRALSLFLKRYKKGK